jgi:hypothetical protein
MSPVIEPNPGAKIVARSHPIASMTAMTSFAQNFGPITSCDTRDDMPTPRWSSRITRLKDASRR